MIAVSAAAAATDFKIAGIDRGAVRRAAGEDIEPAAGVDRGVGRRATGGDIEIAAGGDRGSRCNPPVKHGHGIIVVQNDSVAAFSTGNNIVRHMSSLFVICYYNLNSN